LSSGVKRIRGLDLNVRNRKRAAGFSVKKVKRTWSEGGGGKGADGEGTKGASAISCLVGRREDVQPLRQLILDRQPPANLDAIKGGLRGERGAE